MHELYNYSFFFQQTLDTLVISTMGVGGECWSFDLIGALVLEVLGFLYTPHPNSLDNIVYTSAKGQLTFEKLLSVSDEEPVSRHYSRSVVLENSRDQKLSSHFLNRPIQRLE